MLKSASSLIILMAMISTPVVAAGDKARDKKETPVAAPPVTTMLKTADGEDAGRATLKPDKGGVRLTVQAEGLTPGVHGIHLHQTGVCTPPDFASAGGHWNPTARKHGKDAPDGAHMGDLPNIEIGSNGKGRIDVLIEGAKYSSGTAQLLDGDGTALVIHAAADDYKTDPSGNSGARLACGAFTAAHH